MNDMPSESYQRSLVLEDWTASVGTVFPSTETPSYRSDGTCSESSMHNFLRLSDTEDSITNGNLCALFGSDCSRDTAMCIDIPYTDKSFNASDCQIPTTKSKEDLLDGGFSSLIASENVQNWKNLLLQQVNNSEQHLKFSNSMVQTRECVNRATVVKLTPLKDEPLQNNKINNEKYTLLIGGQHEESHENKIIDKKLSLNNGCLKDDSVQKNKQIPILDGLSSTKCNIKTLLKRRKSATIKSKHPFAKSFFLSPLSYYRKHAKRIYDKYFKMNCAYKYKFQKPSKTAFPNDHAYSISKLHVSKWQNCLRIGKVWQRQKQKRTYDKHTTFTDTQEDSKVCMKSVIDKDQLLNNSLKAEPVHNVNVFEINNHNEDTSLLAKSSTEMDMPILTPLVITEGIVGASSPNSPPMPTLIPFTSENEHPPNPLVDCIPLLSSTSSDLISIGKHKNCESITPCENRLGSFGHEWNVTEVEDWTEHTSSNENVQIKSPSDSNREVNGSCSYLSSSTCILDQYRAVGKTCRKARKSFPRSKLSGESSSLKSIAAESFSANCSMSIVDNLKLQNISNYQPVVLLERIPSVSSSKASLSSSKAIEMEDMLYDNEKTSVQFPPEKTYGKDFVEPEMDIIDGVKFFSFISECQLKKFIKNSKNSLPSNGYDESEDENHMKMGVIIPTKTNDITRIKGWRNKLFIQEPCPSPVSYSSWEHLVTKDLDSTMDFNELQNTVTKPKYEYEKSKHNPLKESNLEITYVTESSLLEPKLVEENKQQFYLTEIEKDKSNTFVKRIEESKINNGLKKIQRNSADDNDRLTESKAVVSTKKIEECYTTSLNRAHATSNNYIKRMEGSYSSICLLNKTNTVMCSESEETLPTENKECDSELMKMLKDKTIAHTSRPTSVNDILKTLPKFTKQEQKITDDDKTSNSALLKRLEEKHVGKTTRSAFVSDMLDDFLKTRSNLGINLLAQCNPNVLPIPADSTIFSVGLLRKQETPPPNKQNSLRETANSHNNKKDMLNVGKESANNSGYTYKTKHNSLISDISSDLQESKQTTIKVEDLNDEKIIEADVKKENDVTDTNVNANTRAKQKPVITKMYENAPEHITSTESSSESEDEQSRGVDVSVNNFEGSSYTSRASANVKQTLPLIRNLYWSRKEHAYKRLAEVFEELNGRHSIESQTLFCPIIDKSLAEKAVSALTNANKVSNSKACNLDDYNTFGKIAATKSVSHNIIQKPIIDLLKDSNHRHRQCSDIKSPPYSNINQATRSKRLIRLPARYMDSVEVAAGTEGRNLPTSLCNEFKQRMCKRKLEGEFNQHLTSQKCIDSHSSMLDELPDANYISAKGKDYDQSPNSSFSDTSESCSRTSCVSIIQEQNSFSENESTKCNVYDKTISWINSNEGQNTCFTKSHVYNKSEVVNKDKLETLSPRGRELLNCMDKVIRVSLPRLPVDPEMVVKCQNNGVTERTINLDNSVSLDSQIFTLMKDNCGFSINNQTEINTSSASLHQKHVAYSENTMQSNASASLHQCSSKMNGKNSQRYSRLKLSSLQSFSVSEVIPISVDNTKTHGTNLFADKKPTLLRVQFSQTEGGLIVRKLKNDEMKKVLLRNLPSKCVQRFSCNNDRLERCRSDGQVRKMHTVTSPSSINTFMRSHRKRKQNKCKLSCCSSDGNVMERKRSCTSSVQQCSTQPHKKSRSVSLDNFGQSLSSCEKRDESTSSSDHSDNCSREKMISEKKDHTEHFNICDSRYGGNMLQGKPVVQLTPERERPINELKQTSELFDKEKKTHIDRNQFFQKRFNITEAHHRYPSSKKVSMKFTDKHLASLQSSTTGGQIISSTTPEEMTNINLNELLETAQKLCGGPCVIKRVRLKNGKTIYVYESLKADTCNGSDNAPVDNAQHQLNVTEKCLIKDNILKRASSLKSLNIVYSDDVKDTCKSSDDITIDFAQNLIDDNAATGKHLLTNNIVQEASSLESLNIVYSDDETISLEDDHSSTSIWMSGSGEPCFVTKFSPKRNEENANSEKPAIPTIISCASISEEEFAKSLNSSESAMEIDQVSDISQ